MSESKHRQISVLLVEDETLIRMMMVDMVEELGHIVAAEASNIQEASALAQTANFEIAVLDVNVGGERIDPVAEIIASRGLPFVFASGYGAIGAPEKFRHHLILQKPFHLERLGLAIEKRSRKVNGTAKPIVSHSIADKAVFCRQLLYARKNTYQTTPRIKIANPVEMAISKSIDGPGLACRASVGVSIITPCFLTTSFVPRDRSG